MSEFFYGCSECDHVLVNDEEFCPEHPNATVIGPIYKAASIMGKKGGASKSTAKVSASRENGRKGGRPRTKVVEFWDDERSLGNGIIVTLNYGFSFEPNGHEGVRGFDTITEAKIATRLKNVYPCDCQQCQTKRMW
jgi:hypothetical protein